MSKPCSADPAVRTDSTNIREAEIELTRQNELLEKAQETARLGSWFTDLTVSPPRLTWSKETLKIYGLQEEEFDGKLETFFDRVYAIDRPKLVAIVSKAVEEGGSFQIDHRIQTKGAHPKWVFSQGRIVRDEANGIHEIAGVVQDITERKQVEAILIEYNQRFEILSKATNDAIWDWDINRNTVIWNHGLTSIFGYSDEFLQTSADWKQDKIHPHDKPAILKSIEEVFQNKESTWTGNLPLSNSRWGIQAYRGQGVHHLSR